MRTELLLPFPPSANNLFATNRKTSARFKTERYEKWIAEAGWMIRSQPDRNNRHQGKVTFSLLVRRPCDKRRHDASNLLKACEDLMVRHGILADDSLIEESRVRWMDEGIDGAKVIIEDFG